LALIDELSVADGAGGLPPNSRPFCAFTATGVNPFEMFAFEGFSPLVAPCVSL